MIFAENNLYYRYFPQNLEIPKQLTSIRSWHATGEKNLLIPESTSVVNHPSQKSYIWR